ncbi:glucose-6-phosphate isomerase [Amylibacter marinus]|uniref:Glucose-6-phosphate isomerase n=1 Tax=Amylibacter marinus TaxID=1475483 RepID=A0ABQ5VU56_9RHOB|nr:glucose-6-phosphate isomerase [Amylibacter marinus]GLQ34977.1 glucose-6-phosphate isomerase [Amylibacter marinus]
MTQQSKIWNDLKSDWARLSDQHLRDLFDTGTRDVGYTAALDDLTLDFSCERIDTLALENLIALARASGLEDAIAAMFNGDHLNTTEDRAVMHVGLRAIAEDALMVDGGAVADLVDPEKARFLEFADAVRSGQVSNAAGKKFTDVINIGIGGSDLGPVMAVRALSEFRGDGPNVHFVSNVDGAHLSDVITGLNPDTTLILVASKTFTTIETITNARAAKRWLQTNLSAKDADQNLAALSTNLKATADFGIPAARVFGFWDWVGGRYSMCSSIGLSIALSVGADNFNEMLRGFRAMDVHFKTAPLAQNLPVLLGLIGIWRRNIMACATVALLPYDQRLEFFPAYVQQMDMESNGKRVTKGGQDVPHGTAPVIWGTPGTNSQHSYFQMLHQGTDIIPVDFILSAQSNSDLTDQHALLTANCLAQSQALAFGKTSAEVRAELLAKGMEPAQVEDLVAHRTFPGNRPSTTILQRAATPYALGRLIALYEHKVFTQGVIWGVNSFDQWGVELGKVLALEVQPLLEDGADLSGLRASTRGAIERINSLKA